MEQIPDLATLQAFTLSLIEQTRPLPPGWRYDAAVPGVIIYDSGKPGRRVGISTYTHGNEPAGIGALRELLEPGAKGLPTQGTLVFLINNLEAARRYCMHAPLPAGKSNWRAIDLNMNRLPDNLADAEPGMPFVARSHKPDGSFEEVAYPAPPYEVLRAKELLPIWRSLDAAMDIHTTSQIAPPMLVLMQPHNPLTPPAELPYRDFPVSRFVSGFFDWLKGRPVGHFYGGDDKGAVFAIEAGQHESRAAFTCARNCVYAFMHNMGLIDALPRAFHAPSIAWHHQVLEPVWVPRGEQAAYLAGPLRNYARVAAGSPLLVKRQGNDAIPLVNAKSPADFGLDSPKPLLSIMAPKGGDTHPVTDSEEALFLITPGEEVVLGGPHSASHWRTRAEQAKAERSARDSRGAA